MSIEQHETAVLTAFAAVLRAEEQARLAKVELDRVTTGLRTTINQAEAEQDAAWAEIAALMAETGEPEITLPGEANDFVIGWTTPREAVDVPDAQAVPDEFVQVERKPRKKEIGDHLKTLREQSMPPPNWATFKRGEVKLGYRLKKRGAA